MGTFSRLRYVVAANVNALIEKAEDPEKLLRALIREMEDASDEARAASVGLLAEQARLQRTVERLQQEVGEWQQRAEDAVDQDRDDLARAALKARVELQAQHAAAAEEEQRLSARIEQMEQDMQTLKAKLADAKSKLKGMQSGKTPRQVNRESAPARPGERRMRRAMDRFDRLQSQVDNLEARVRSYEVGGPQPAVWNEPTTDKADPAIEAELERLKRRLHEEAEQE